MGIEAVIAIIGLVMSAASMAQQAHAQEEMKKRQGEAAAESRNIAEQNAKASEMEYAESKRKQELLDKNEEATARAAAAASGFVYSEDNNPNSIALSLASQKKENQMQMSYADMAAKSRADLIRMGGDQSYRIGMANADAEGNKATASWLKAGTTAAEAAKKGYDWWGTQNTGTTIKGGGVYSDYWGMGSGV